MKTTSMALRVALLAGVAAIAAARPTVAAVTAAAEVQVYDLQSQSLEASLKAVALRSGRTILAPSRLLAGKQAPPLKGRFQAIDAYRALLAGSGLSLSLVGDTVVVRAVGDPPGDQAGADKPGTTEIVVTGSHIRGAPPAAPVHRIDRADIEQSGYSQVGDVMRSLPENFGGGQNPGVLAGAAVSNVSNQNGTNASSVNLRGLGSDATLVLLDGHRLAADGAFEAPDISAIPLGAIERIEIVTDGASALYGSDAVAGVANFILRKDYDGAEFSERIGGATAGGGLEQTYSALGGRIWDSGRALASVEYSRQDAITTSERDFTSGAAPQDDLSQAQTRTSAFVSLGQDLSSWARLRLDGLYAQRRTGYAFDDQIGGFFYNSATTARSYFLAPELDLTLPGSWSADISGGFTGASDGVDLAYAGGDIDDRYRNADQSVEVTADGPLFRLPGGTLKLAFGGGHRHETFGYLQTAQPIWDGARDVSYAYGELSVPLVGPEQAIPAVRALDLTLAGRMERYSDFGATTNPKVGLRYEPARGLAFRATWGTSFKAPQFIQTVEPRVVWYYPASTFGGTSGTALLDYGGNPDLKPERSNAWTLGADWTPAERPSFKLSLTYFHIDYTGRVVQPVSDAGSALTSPIYAPFVTLNPTPAQQSALIASTPSFFNVVGAAYDPSQVVAIVEDRYVNATGQAIHGVDLSVGDRTRLAGGELEGFASASWLRLVQQTVPGAPSAVLTGTLFNPAKLRARAGATFVRGPVTLTGIVNYIAGETDTGVTPTQPIASWTTVDFNLAYRFAHTAWSLPALEAALAVTNAFDKDPPFAKGAAAQIPGLYFDSTNASAIGRFIALTLRQRF